LCLYALLLTALEIELIEQRGNLFSEVTYLCLEVIDLFLKFNFNDSFTLKFGFKALVGFGEYSLLFNIVFAVLEEFVLQLIHIALRTCHNLNALCKFFKTFHKRLIVRLGGLKQTLKFIGLKFPGDYFNFLTVDMLP
jgi:hypothetical protein